MVFPSLLEAFPFQGAPQRSPTPQLIALNRHHLLLPTTLSLTHQLLIDPNQHLHLLMVALNSLPLRVVPNQTLQLMLAVSLQARLPRKRSPRKLPVREVEAKVKHKANEISTF